MKLNKKNKQKRLNPIFTIVILTLIVMLMSLLFSLLGIEGHKTAIVNNSIESSITTVISWLAILNLSGSFPSLFNFIIVS